MSSLSCATPTNSSIQDEPSFKSAAEGHRCCGISRRKPCVAATEGNGSQFRRPLYGDRNNDEDGSRDKRSGTAFGRNGRKDHRAADGQVTFRPLPLGGGRLHGLLLPAPLL